MENDDNESGKTDLEKIAAALQQKSKFLKGVFNSSENFLFQTFSEYRPNTLATISENASIKDQSHIRCVIVTPDSDKFKWNGCKTIFPDSQESAASSVRNSTAIFEDVRRPHFSISTIQVPSTKNGIKSEQLRLNHSYTTDSSGIYS